MSDEPSCSPPDDPGEGESKLLPFARPAGVLVAFISTLLTDWPGAATVQLVVGAVCVCMLAFHVENQRTRIRLGHWRHADLVELLVPELFLGLLFPSVALAAILALPPTSVVLIVVGLTFLCAQSFYERLQKSIYALVDKHNLEHGTEWFAKRKPWRAAHVDDTIEDARDEVRGPGPHSVLTVWVGEPWQPLLSRTRTVFVYAMFATACIAFGAGVNGPTESSKSEHGQQQEGKIGQDRSGDGESPVPAESTESNQEGEKSTDESPGECSLRPGDGAPEWAEDELNSLYLGNPRLEATPPPGFKFGGCTTGAIVPAAGEGEFVYAIGRNPAGEVRSVAVNSLRFGPAIFLSPSAQRVLRRIREGQMPLGGYPTINIGGGDMAVILTPKGSAILTRSSKHPPGLPDVATPYDELPPSVAVAFAEAMNERGAWLWPASPRRRDGIEAFRFRSRASEALPDIEVLFDRATGVAVRGERRYEPRETQLSLPELRHHAESAWWIGRG